MAIPIKIKLTKENRKLTSLIKEDILIFPDREETIKLIDRWNGELYTSRIKGKIEERILYRLDKNDNGEYTINQNSIGIIRQTKRLKGKK